MKIQTATDIGSTANFYFRRDEANQLPPPIFTKAAPTYMNPGVDKAMRGRRNDVVEAMLGAMFRYQWLEE